MNDLLGELKPGCYVVAVSGGVDSVALLDMLAKDCEAAGLKLVVAHIDHGIREDSMKDLQLVSTLAKEYGLPFYFAKVRLGAMASEELARTVRYGFLYSVMHRLHYDAVLTAHHKDDLLETSLMHVLRGTGRRGLAGFNNHKSLQRPLLSYTKANLIAYAKTHGLRWHEDSTNQDMTYKRNAIRRDLVPKLETKQPGFTEEWLKHAAVAAPLNVSIDAALRELMDANILHNKSCQIFDRHWFVMLPHEVSREVIVGLLKQIGLQDISRKRVEQLTIRLKTGKINSRYDCDKRWEFRIEQSPERETLLKLALKQGEC